MPHPTHVTLTIIILLALGGCDRADEPGSTAAADVPAWAPSRAAPEPLPPITSGPLRVEPGGLQFGQVLPQSDHEGTLELINTSDSDLRLIEIKSSCVCTAPENIADRVIPAGGSVSFMTSYNAPEETGPRTAKLFVRYEHEGRTAMTQVPLEAEIVMAVESEPPFVDALKTVTGTVTLSSRDGRPFRVITSNGAAPVFADGFDPSRDEPRSEYAIQWQVEDRPETNCAGMRLWWPIETDRPDCPILPLRVRHQCTGSRADPLARQRTWYFAGYMSNLGAIRAGEPVEMDVEVTNPQQVNITGVESLTPDARAELLDTTHEGGGKTECRVRFTVRQGYEGLLYALVKFQSPRGDKETAFLAKVEP